MDPQREGSGSGSVLHNSAPPRSSNEEAAQLRAAIQASLAAVDRVQVGEAADEADSDVSQFIVTDAAESGSLHSTAGLKELAQHETALDIQNEQSANAESDMPLGAEARIIEARIIEARINAYFFPDLSNEDHIPWLGEEDRLACLVALLLLVSSLLFWLVFFGFGLLWVVNSYDTGTVPHTEYLKNLSPTSDLVTIMLGSFLWLPLLIMFSIIPKPQDQPSLVRMICAMAILFGPFFMVLMYWAGFGLTALAPTLRGWHALTLPRSYYGCDARVSHDQSQLFTPQIYLNQFAGFPLLWTEDGRLVASVSQLDSELYESVRTNATLCGHGFEANTALYGMGFRLAVYLQWISSLLANNGLPAGTKSLQHVYLIFCLAICVTTIVLSVTHTCVFSIEIELLYWLYWGGVSCVFASSPCPIRLGLKPRWVELDWIVVISFATHTVMIYHAIWFSLYAYDGVFSRMPCGTYHFFFAKLSEPSKCFSVVRTVLTQFTGPFIVPLLLIFPIIVVLLLSEVKHYVQSSTLFQLVFATSERSETATVQSQSMVYDASKRRSRILRFYLRVKAHYYKLKIFFGFPWYGRGRIRLVTPLDLMYRRYVAPTGSEA
jgi:hypothetical protein